MAIETQDIRRSYGGTADNDDIYHDGATYVGYVQRSGRPTTATVESVCGRRKGLAKQRGCGENAKRLIYTVGVM